MSLVERLETFFKELNWKAILLCKGNPQYPLERRRFPQENPQYPLNANPFQPSSIRDRSLEEGRQPAPLPCLKPTGCKGALLGTIPGTATWWRQLVNVARKEQSDRW